jgi:hypothetical protein
MKDLRTRKALLAGSLLCVVSLLTGSALSAQIERLNLNQMVAKTDNAVVGEITKHEVIRIDHPVDGPELYYTHLTIKGESLVNGAQTTVKVTFPGGFIDAENGVWNSEAPSDADTKVGNQIVAFYRWSDNMGGDVEGNALYASHGGLFRTIAGRKGTVVQGRGEGYAIANNVKLTTLDAQITAIDKAQREAQQQNK